MTQVFKKMTAAELRPLLAPNSGYLVTAAPRRGATAAGLMPGVQENARSYKRTPFNRGYVGALTKDGTRCLIECYGVWINIADLVFSVDTL
jgi:hypothetical protein